MPASAHSDERCRRSRRVACSRAISTSGRGSLEGAQGISAAGRSEGSTHRRPLLLLLQNSPPSAVADVSAEELATQARQRRVASVF